MIISIFKSALPSFSYFFKNGMTAVFINGRYTTSEPAQVAELMAEIKQVGSHLSAHPYVFVDADEKEIDSEALTPMEIVKLKAREEARAELLAEQEAERARALSGTAVSTSTSGAFKDSIANTSNIAQATPTGAVPFAKVSAATPPVPVPTVPETTKLEVPEQEKTAKEKIAAMLANMKKDA